MLLPSPQIGLQTDETLQACFAAVVDVADIGILFISDDGASYNNAFTRCFPEHVHLLTGEIVSDIQHVFSHYIDDTAGFAVSVEHLVTTRKPQEGTMQFRDGRVFEWKGYAVKTGLGRSGWSSAYLFIDRTVPSLLTKQLHIQTQFLSAALHYSHEGIFVTTASHSYKQCNSKLFDFFDGDTTVFEPSKIEEIRDAHNRYSYNGEDIALSIQELRATKQEQTGVLRCRNGTFIEYRGTFVPDIRAGHEGTDDADPVYMWHFRDITAHRRLQIKFKKSKGEFTALTESFCGGLYFLNVIRNADGKPVDYVFCYANRYFLNTFENAAQPILGTSAVKFFEGTRVLSHPHFRGIEDAYNEASEGRADVYHFYTPSIKVAPYRYSSIFPSTKNHIAVVTHNETPQVLANLRATQLEKIIANMSESFYWILPDGVVTYANLAAARMFGFETVDDFLLQNIRQYHGEFSDDKSWNTTVNKILEGAELEFQTLIKRADGTQLLVNIVANSYVHETHSVITACLRDLTAVRDQLAEEQAMLAKSQLLQQMSHELLTPLNGILGSVAVLENGGLNVSQQQEFLETIRKSGQHLESLISEMLDFSNLESHKLKADTTEVDLLELLDAVMSIAGKQAIMKGLRFRYIFHDGLPRYIVSDAKCLNNVLKHLLSNAMRFTDSGTVRVLVSMGEDKFADTKYLELGTKRQNKWWEQDRENIEYLKFVVQDTGCGIPAEQQKKIFEPFTQQDMSWTREHGGAGLGLSIAQGMVKLLGGEIACQSELGKGSSFWFRVPLVRVSRKCENIPSLNRLLSEDEIRKQTEDSEDTIGAGLSDIASYAGTPSVLLVEDNKVNQLVTASLMRNAGYSVTVAADGVIACEAIQEWTFDIILMDLQMPNRDGFEAARIIREMEAAGRAKHTGRIPIIALTANVSDEDRRRSKESGMDDFQTKPVNSKQLLETMRGYIGSGSSDRV